METGLDGRTAVVAGATSGIGLAVARSLAAEGANLVLGGRRQELLQEHASALPSAIGVVADLTLPDGPERLLSAARERFGSVDVLVLNGGGPAPGEATELGVDDAEEATRLLLLPHVRLVRGVLDDMRGRGWGRIIAVGSSGIQQPLDGLVSSNVGRAALAGYLKTLASEVAADGVTVNLVLPGRIETDRVTSIDQKVAERTGRSEDSVRRAAEATIPVGRYGRPDEFAAVVTFVASTAASYVTGEQIRCDGGLVRAH
ncbi:MAG: SDR family oxidoreductase [Nocardioidaceae bacterium]